MLKMNATEVESIAKSMKYLSVNMTAERKYLTEISKDEEYLCYIVIIKLKLILKNSK